MSKIEIRDFPEPLPRDVLDRAAKLSSANLCDGMIGLGIPRDGCMESGIYPVSPAMRSSGTICTVDTDAGNNMPIHLALYKAPPGSGYVMVIDGNNVQDYPYFGDNMMLTGKVIGLGGMVVDGCVRDREGCAGMEFPVFARGYLPRGPQKIDFGGINRPISCGGLLINPGDLIIADADGVAVAPRDRVYEILDKAEKKLAYDEDRKAVMREYETARLKGEPTPELAPKWVKDIIGK